MTICLAPRGACGGGVFRSRFTCRVFGRASILASPSLERRRMTKMPPDGYPAFQYLQSVRVSKFSRNTPCSVHRGTRSRLGRLWHLSRPCRDLRAVGDRRHDRRGPPRRGASHHEVHPQSRLSHRRGPQVRRQEGHPGREPGLRHTQREDGGPPRARADLAKRPIRAHRCPPRRGPGRDRPEPWRDLPQRPGAGAGFSSTITPWPGAPRRRSPTCSSPARSSSTRA